MGGFQSTLLMLLPSKRFTKRSSARVKKRLMLAVLESAVEDFQKYVLARNPRGKQLFQQAEEWFLDRDGDELFSFENVCETLRLHPEHIRKGLMVWKQAKLKLSSVEGQCAVPPKLSKSRVKHPS